MAAWSRRLLARVARRVTRAVRLAAVFSLIGAFIALGDPIPSSGWRMAIFGVYFL